MRELAAQGALMRRFRVCAGAALPGRSRSVLASWPREVPVFESGAACARFAGPGLRPASAANAERGANNDEMAAFQNCNGRRAGDPSYLRARTDAPGADLLHFRGPGQV